MASTGKTKKATTKQPAPKAKAASSQSNRKTSGRGKKAPESSLAGKAAAAVGMAAAAVGVVAAVASNATARARVKQGVKDGRKALNNARQAASTTVEETGQWVSDKLSSASRGLTQATQAMRKTGERIGSARAVTARGTKKAEKVLDTALNTVQRTSNAIGTLRDSATKGANAITQGARAAARSIGGSVGRAQQSIKSSIGLAPAANDHADQRVMKLRLQIQRREQELHKLELRAHQHGGGVEQQAKLAATRIDKLQEELTKYRTKLGKLTGENS